MLNMLKASPEEIKERELANNVVQSLLHNKDILPTSLGVANVKTGIMFIAVDSRIAMSAADTSRKVEAAYFKGKDAFQKLMNAYDVPTPVIDKIMANATKE